LKKQGSRKWHAILIVLVGCAGSICLAARGERDQFPSYHHPALSVETVGVKRADYRIRVPGWGLVEPRETIEVRTEISGKVSRVPANVFTGSMLQEGALLFSIDEREYQNALAEARAAREQAQQALAIEKGRRTIAETEWKMLENTKWQGHRNKALALREPQMKEREAVVQIAQAKLAQAALNVERARITAPCGGVIIEEQLARGQFLETGSVAVRMACTDRYHVMASFSPEYYLDPGVPAVTINIGPNTYEGAVKAVLPRINPETRQKQVLVEFRGDRITLGAYASLTLPGPLFKNAIIVPSESLRSGDTVWLLNQSHKLEIRKVKVLGQDMFKAVIGQGLSEHDHVVLSHIASPLQGMELRTKESMKVGEKNSFSSKGYNG
jgi:RND family efflux transporter MFP subunit